MRFRSSLLLAAGVLLGSPALAQPAPAAAAAASLDRIPLGRLFGGDLSRAGDFGDGISDAWVAGEKAAVIAGLKALEGIDRNALDADDRVRYDVFNYWIAATSAA